MARFKISAEHIDRADLNKVRAFVKGEGIRVTKTGMSEIFTGQGWVVVSCDDRRGANKVQRFIWDECNGGAWCSIERLK